MSERAAELVVGVDLGGTNMQIGVVDGNDRVVAHRRASTDAERGLEAVVDRIAKQVDLACVGAGTALGRVAAVGVAAAGAVDMPNGVVLAAPNLGWTDAPLRDMLADRLGRPVVVDNDVNAAVWGEYRAGAGRGRGDVLGVWIGTGVGGGLVIHGSIYHGETFTAGEIGHTVILPDGPPGARTIEDLCSRSGIARHALAALPDHPGSVLPGLTGGSGEITRSGQIGDAWAAGDPVIVPLVERAATLLGIAIANWVTVLALDNVIIGGGVGEALGRPLLDRIRAAFERDVFPDRGRTCELVLTTLEDRAGLLGAALLARARDRQEA